MPTIDTPIPYDTETDAPTHHPSAMLNLINRYPEMGPGFEGYSGNTTRVIEIETPGTVFLTPDEADALALRLIRHAAVMRI